MKEEKQSKMKRRGGKGMELGMMKEVGRLLNTSRVKGGLNWSSREKRRKARVRLRLEKKRKTAKLVSFVKLEFSNRCKIVDMTTFYNDLFDKLTKLCRVTFQ